MQLTFLGAAGTVTGSKILLEATECRMLIESECGLPAPLRSAGARQSGARQ